MEDENKFKILIATDIHLGYAEKDPIRGDDSFVSFEEILIKAKENKADFVLLGGDLFHENKPSQRCLYRCITLLRRYCMGDKPVSFEFLSDQSVNFGHCPFPNVNYEDPNLNISLPVFSIHGNHDDPSVNWRLSSLDILSATGLVNYFGWYQGLQKLEIRPLLMRKGSSHLALYGLGSIKDERLSRLLEQNKVEMHVHKEKRDDWFHLLTLHQNHVIRGTSQHSFIPEASLPSFLDFVVWGHEHECIPYPQRNSTTEFFVLQPGSSVATSLSEGEAAPKNIFMMEVIGKRFKVDPIPLETVRPFVFDTLKLSNYDSLQPVDEDKHAQRKKRKDEPTLSEKVEEFVKEKIESMIAEAISQRTGHEKQPKKPLIRLRLEYNCQEQMINTVRVGNCYMDEVANPSDIILQKKEVVRGAGKIKGEKEKLDEEALVEAAEHARELQEQLGEIRVETVVEEYFRKGGQVLDETGDKKPKDLDVLSIKGLIEGVRRFVDKQESEALVDVFKLQVSKTVKHLNEERVPGDEESVYEGLQRFKESRTRNKDEEEKEVQNYLDSLKKTKGSSSRASKDDSEPEDPFEELEALQPQKGRGSGRARGRGSRGSRGRGSRAVVDDDDDDEMDTTPAPTRAPRGRGRGRASNRATSRNTGSGSSMNQSRNINEFFSSGNASKSKLVYISDSDD